MADNKQKAISAMADYKQKAIAYRTGKPRNETDECKIHYWLHQANLSYDLPRKDQTGYLCTKCGAHRYEIVRFIGDGPETSTKVKVVWRDGK